MEGWAGTLRQSIVHGGGAGSHRPMGGGAPDRANHSLYLYALDRKSRPLLKQRTENELAHVPHTNISQHLHPRVPSQHPSRAPDPYMLCKAQPTHVCVQCHDSRAELSLQAITWREARLLRGGGRLRAAATAMAGIASVTGCSTFLVCMYVITGAPLSGC